MKNYDERTQSINKKASIIRKKRNRTKKAIVSLCVIVVVALSIFAGVEFGLYDGGDLYFGSEYYPLISKISKYNAENRDFLVGDDFIEAPGASVDVEYNGAGLEGNKSEYVETTLNQYAGVVEGDVVKRTRSNIFVLTYEYRKLLLYVYDIAGENTHRINTYCVMDFSSGSSDSYYGVLSRGFELYLSEDGQTATIFATLVKAYSYNGKDAIAINLDISQPTDIRETSRAIMSGENISSRKIGNEFLLVTQFYVPSVVDFSNKEEYVPHYSNGLNGEVKLLPMDKIFVPNTLDTCTYTVVAKLSLDGLEFMSTYAVLSFTNDVCVSQEHVFASRSYIKNMTTGAISQWLWSSNRADGEYTRKTDIICLSYQNELINCGVVTIDGTIKDRYSMDEKDGVLRVVATLDKALIRSNRTSIYTNVSLYCIDIHTKQVLSSVDSFADENERAMSVRFDGDFVYVCTAVRKFNYFTDPVFAFDLSDIYSITSKDTGTIPGYSFTLLPFGDYLLGIGYDGEVWPIEAKIELYRETESGLESVCAYTINFALEEEYKSHFINVEAGLIGLPLSRGTDSPYLLLHFDGSNLKLIACKTVGSTPSQYVRAFYEDGVYIVGSSRDSITYVDTNALIESGIEVEIDVEDGIIFYGFLVD